MLELDQIALERDGVTWIRPTSLRIDRGTLTVLLGATGAGKTTLMRLMAGLDQASSGRLLLDGVDVTRKSVRQRDVAMVYQQFVNYPRLSVRENIASPLRVRGAGRDEVHARVEEAARLLKLQDFLERKPLELSGGQQQRVALARALAKRADLVLLDEPLANLDYKLREELRAELPPLFAASGSMLVYATSDPAEAVMLGGTTVAMHEGRVEQAGPAGEVHRRPISLLAASICSDPPLNLLEQGDGKLGFRPHHLRPEVAGPGDLGFSARVLGSERTGSETFVHIDVETRRWIMLAPGAHAPADGAAIDVAVARRHVMRFSAEGSALGRLDQVGV